MRGMRFSGALTLGLIGVLAATTGCPIVSTVVFIPDPGLDAAIRAELGQPLGFLTAADLLKLRSLDARNLNIGDLRGLEYCTNLVWLDLDTNRVSDITAIANLENLATLNLDSNEIFDIGPLAGLLRLDALSLFDNQVADITALVVNAQNGGLGAGDQVILEEATLSDKALNIDVPFLESKSVNVILVQAAS